MVESMNLKKHIFDLHKKLTRRGSILVEATIILPIFIIAVCAIISIIPIIGTCEKVVFTACDEMHMVDAKAAITPIQLSFPARLENRIAEENKNVRDVKVNQFLYRYRGTAGDDLISGQVKVCFQEKNPLGLFDAVEFDLKVLSRGFTGSYRKNTPMARAEIESPKESHIVYIFPAWGERYHKKTCKYVTDSYKMDNWHYVEIQKEDAKAKGYTPCLKCGGG